MLTRMGIGVVFRCIFTGIAVSKFKEVSVENNVALGLETLRRFLSGACPPREDKGKSALHTLWDITLTKVRSYSL